MEKRVRFDVEDIAIISKQDIGGGGGCQLFFDDVYFIGSNLNLAGNIEWGQHIDVCADFDYGVYVFGTQSLSLGGWSQPQRDRTCCGNFPSGGNLPPGECPNETNKIPERA